MNLLISINEMRKHYKELQDIFNDDNNNIDI